ncbi:hypothetical protein ACVBEQ_19920 [Nakamurella sp. GG22]
MSAVEQLLALAKRECEVGEEFDPGERSRRFWDAAARRNPMWHIATGVAADADTFYALGRREADLFL